MFKILLIASSLAIIFAAIVPANAQSRKESQSAERTYDISPRELISLARHGRFKSQGIPSQNNFRNGVRTGKITAEDLVASAIANNRLPQEATGDRQYLEAVAKHLKSGGCGA